MSQWTLFSNHGHVLLYLATEPDARLRDVADAVGITERAVQKIVRDLQDGGAITISKQGRRNRYRINGRKPLRHELESHRSIGSLVKWMKKDTTPAKAPAEKPVAVRRVPSPEPVPPVQPVPPVAREPASSGKAPAERERPGPGPADSKRPAQSDQKPDQKSDQKPDQKPEQKPEQKPDQKAGEKPQKKPGGGRRKGADDEQQGSLF